MQQAFATPEFLTKITSPQDAVSRVAELREKGTVVFTNGVFDVLHRGHATYLAQARSLGTSLVVALNTDASSKRLGKGEDRPLNILDDRLALIAALASVSLVKGGDYDMTTLAETQLVMSYGGRAQAIPFVSGYSTTALVQKIRAH
jgi:cytidyltransferase-like protein